MDVTRERIFLSPNYLENRNCLFLTSVHIFLPEQAFYPKQAFSFSGGEGTAAGAPHVHYFVVTLYLTTPLCGAFCTILHLFPPMHLDLSPPYLSDSQMGLDCLIRESRDRVISGQTAPRLLPGQRSVPH